MNTFKKLTLALAISASVCGLGLAQNKNYETAQKAMHSQNFQKAYENFKQAESDNEYREASMYWQGYTLFKLKQNNKAKHILKSLLKNHPTSQWTDNARVLLFENSHRKEREDMFERVEHPERPAHPERPEHPESPHYHKSSENLRLFEIQENFLTNQEQGFEEVKGLLEKSKDMVTKVNAIQLLGMSDLKKSQDYLFRFIEDNKNKDLDSLAIQMLSIRNDKSVLKQLEKLYKKTSDKEQKKAILQGFIHSQDANKIMSLMENEKDFDLNAQMIQLLGIFGATKELNQLVDRIDNPKLSKSLLEALAISGDSESIIKIIKKASDPDLKASAIESLAIHGGKDNKLFLFDSFKKEKNKRVREALMSSLSIAGLNSKEAMELIIKENNKQSKQELLHHFFNNIQIQDFVKLSKQEYDQDIKRDILNLLSVRGAHREIIEMYKTLDDPRMKKDTLMALAINPSQETKEFLMELYKTKDTSLEIKKGIIENLMIQEDSELLAELLATETEFELKKQIIQAISMSDPAVLLDKLNQEK